MCKVCDKLSDPDLDFIIKVARRMWPTYDLLLDKQPAIDHTHQFIIDLHYTAKCDCEKIDA